MDLGLKNKTALVTGGSRGLGFATARLLAQEGPLHPVRLEEGVGRGVADVRVDSAMLPELLHIGHRDSRIPATTTHLGNLLRFSPGEHCTRSRRLAQGVAVVARGG